MKFINSSKICVVKPQNEFRKNFETQQNKSEMWEIKRASKNRNSIFMWKKFPSTKKTESTEIFFIKLFIQGFLIKF